MPGAVSEAPDFAGNTPHDVAMGRLIERTNAMQKQAERLEKLQEHSNEVLNRLNVTLVKMEGVLRQLGADHSEHRRDVEKRLKDLECYKDDMEFISGIRSKFTSVVGWCIVALIVIAIGAFGLHLILQNAGVDHGLI